MFLTKCKTAVALLVGIVFLAAGAAGLSAIAAQQDNQPKASTVQQSDKKEEGKQDQPEKDEPKKDQPTREELKKEVAVLKELLRWQGAYQTDDGHSFTVTGDRWTGKSSAGEVYSGKIKIIEVREKVTVADQLVEEGPTKGKTVKAIYRVEGDTLHYCGTYDFERPTEFKTREGETQYYAWKRINK